MVLRKAWVTGLGTYSVDSSTDPYDPDAGEVYFTVAEPKNTQEDESFGGLVSIKNKITNNNMEHFLRVSSLANLATVQPPEATDGEAAGWSAQGAPTEVAIEVFARRFGWNRVEMCQGPKASWKHITEFPFDSDVKKMSAVYEHVETNGYHVLTKVSDALFRSGDVTITVLIWL
jgi:magnesium-transporting ATPase (P-type)